MGKKTRQRKTTVFCSMEGEAELLLLEYLKEQYSDLETMSFPDNPLKGGDPNRIIYFAIQNMYNYDRSFAWIDEDKDINKETRQSLAKFWRLDFLASEEILVCPIRQIQARFNPGNQKPVLIVSQPVCFESLALRVLGHSPKYDSYDCNQRKLQIRNLKSALSGIFVGHDQLEYYRLHLSKSLLEERRKQIPELNLLIQMISKKSQ